MSSILITGGTGSFGQAFVEKLLDHDQPFSRIIIYSRGEEKQVEMQRRLASHPLAATLRWMIGDVRDFQRLMMAMQDVDTVVHAAALKHVPVAEYNPMECVATNVGGTQNVIAAALAMEVNRVVMLSTDKAVHPVNLYGATKLVAERLMVSANNLSGEGGCKFSVVRYGNVYGSSGSVVPLFVRQAKAKQPLTITDLGMTRFHITMDDATSLVLYCRTIMQGGEIFVPQLPSLRIASLAEAVVTKYRSENGYDLTGIRPGEKRHEMLMSAEEAAHAVRWNGMYVILPEVTFWHHPPEYPLGKAVEATPYISGDNTEWLSATDLEELV